MSLLPIARGCQAKCPFCFSEASVSAVQEQSRINLEHVESLALNCRERGAERFVITGGGEPGLVKHSALLDFIRLGHRIFGKTVLITNGHHLSSLDEDERLSRLSDYDAAGLDVLAVSRHHAAHATNARIMSLDVQTQTLAASLNQHRSRWKRLRMRLICVLQAGGVESRSDIAEYLDWAAMNGVPEVCFKELYVSTSTESEFHAYPANTWSRSHRIPLSMVVEFAIDHGFHKIGELPWGSPIFRGRWRNRELSIAAYTEPSLYWERTHGIARSWNLMASGKCLVSLEDRASTLVVPTVAS
jgi:organic radical activating enzyme